MNVVTKKKGACPSCGGKVKAWAVRCRHCGEEFLRTRKIAGIAITVIFVFAGIATIWTSTGLKNFFVGPKGASVEMTLIDDVDRYEDHTSNLVIGLRNLGGKPARVDSLVHFRVDFGERIDGAPSWVTNFYFIDKGEDIVQLLEPGQYIEVLAKSRNVRLSFPNSFIDSWSIFPFGTDGYSTDSVVTAVVSVEYTSVGKEMVKSWARDSLQLQYVWKSPILLITRPVFRRPKS